MYALWYVFVYIHMYVCACIVLGEKKHFNKKKNVVTLGEEKNSEKTKLYYCRFTCLQLNVSHLVDGL